jgi:hypothetical protein
MFTVVRPVGAVHAVALPLSWHSHPSESVPLTSTQPALHAPMPHTPLVHVSVMTFGSAMQSLAVQHAVLGMHRLLAAQIDCPVGQPHVPPVPIATPVHTSPITGQSESPQHVV